MGALATFLILSTSTEHLEKKPWAGFNRLQNIAKALLPTLCSAQDSLEVLFKSDSDSAGLEWGLGFCISNQLPRDAGTTH